VAPCQVDPRTFPRVASGRAVRTVQHLVDPVAPDYGAPALRVDPVQRMSRGVAYDLEADDLDVTRLVRPHRARFALEHRAPSLVRNVGDRRRPRPAGVPRAPRPRVGPGSDVDRISRLQLP